MHSPASNNDKEPYELSVTSEPSVGGRGVNLNLDNVFKYTGGVDGTPKNAVQDDLS